MNIISNKKYFVLSLLFVMIIILFIRANITGHKQTHVPLKYKPRDKNTAAKKAGPENFNIPELKLNELNKPKVRYQENTKNIFKSIIVPPVKYIPPPPVVKPPPAPVPVPKRNPFEEELKRFQFIGFSENKGNKSLFLSKGDNLFVVSKGETIEDRFLVKDITQTDIILTIMNQTDVEFKLSLKDDQGISGQNYQGPPEVYEPEVYEEPFQVPEELPENPPARPVPKPGQHRPSSPSHRVGPPSEPEF